MSDLTKEEWAEVEKYVVPPIVRKLKAVIHVVTPESSSGTLWAEIQRLQAVEAESARTIAHLNQTHREVSEMQQARIAEMESHVRLLRDTIQDVLGRVAGGRLLYFGASTGYTPQIGSSEVDHWRTVLTRTEPKP